MILIELKKENSTIKLLSHKNNDLSLITANADDLFKLDSTIKKSISDFNSDYSSEIAELKNKLAQLKSRGITGYPLDLHDAELYALNNKITITDRLEINI